MACWTHNVPNQQQGTSESRGLLLKPSDVQRHRVLLRVPPKPTNERSGLQKQTCRQGLFPVSEGALQGFEPHMNKTYLAPVHAFALSIRKNTTKSVHGSKKNPGASSRQPLPPGDRGRHSWNPGSTTSGSKPPQLEATNKYYSISQPSVVRRSERLRTKRSVYYVDWAWPHVELAPSSYKDPWQRVTIRGRPAIKLPKRILGLRSTVLSMFFNKTTTRMNDEAWVQVRSSASSGSSGSSAFDSAFVSEAADGLRFTWLFFIFFSWPCILCVTAD